MRPLLNQRFDALGVIDIVSDHDQSSGEVGVPVGAIVAGAAAHLEASLLQEPLQSVPHARWGLSGEQRGLADPGVG